METPFEHTLVSMYKPDMIQYLNAHPKAFDEAAALAVSNKQPYAWRAAWLLWSCMGENDRRLKKHVKKIAAYLPKAQDNQKRELLKILLMFDIDDAYGGQLFDDCMVIWQDISKDPSIRINALKMLVKTAQQYPELAHEIMAAAGEHFIAPLSPGVIKSVGKLLQQLPQG